MYKPLPGGAPCYAPENPEPTLMESTYQAMRTKILEQIAERHDNASRTIASKERDASKGREDSKGDKRTSKERRKKEKKKKSREEKIKELEEKVARYGGGSSFAASSVMEAGGAGGGGNTSITGGGNTSITGGGNTSITGNSSITGTSFTGGPTESSFTSASASSATGRRVARLPKLSGNEKVLNFLNKTPVGRPWRAIPNLDSKPPSPVGTAEIEAFENKKKKLKKDEERRQKSKANYLASVYSEFESMQRTEKKDKQLADFIEQELAKEEKQKWDNNRKRNEIDRLNTLKKIEREQKRKNGLLSDEDEKDSTTKQTLLHGNTTHHQVSNNTAPDISPTRILYPCKGKKKKHPLLKPGKSYNCDVKPHCVWGEKAHDAKVDGEGYWIAGDLLETAEQKEVRQEREIAKQWQERAERQSLGKQKELPCWGNETETKRYKEKLKSTYGLMSIGEGWEQQRIISHNQTDERYKFLTQRGNKGTYYFGQPVQEEDLVVRGVGRVGEASKIGLKGTYDWKDTLYDVDPNEKPLAYIPERVEGVVTAPESYKSRAQGESKYGPVECNVRRTAL